MIAKQNAPQLGFELFEGRLFIRSGPGPCVYDCFWSLLLQHGAWARDLHLWPAAWGLGQGPGSGAWALGPGPGPGLVTFFILIDFFLKKKLLYFCKVLW